MAKRQIRDLQETADAGLELPGWIVDQLDYPTFRITLIAKIMDRLTIRAFGVRGDLSYAEWRVLARLASSTDGATVGQVADLAWVDRAEVSRAAHSLEQRGYSGRRKNPQDGRSPILYLTDKGRKLYLSSVRERRTFHELLLADLTPNDRAVLDDLLRRIGQRLDKLIKM